MINLVTPFFLKDSVESRDSSRDWNLMTRLVIHFWSFKEKSVMDHECDHRIPISWSTHDWLCFHVEKVSTSAAISWSTLLLWKKKRSFRSRDINVGINGFCLEKLLFCEETSGQHLKVANGQNENENIITRIISFQNWIKMLSWHVLEIENEV